MQLAFESGQCGQIVWFGDALRSLMSFLEPLYEVSAEFLRNRAWSNLWLLFGLLRGDRTGTRCATARRHINPTVQMRCPRSWKTSSTLPRRIHRCRDLSRESPQISTTSKRYCGKRGHGKRFQPSLSSSAFGHTSGTLGGRRSVPSC